ncbi:MAG: DUF6353 family protein [Oscillospiraceae bacterium]|jgi:hypothetical protein|nr:DUF6353 family protein [Oscillospiraceae bacterium]
MKFNIIKSIKNGTNKAGFKIKKHSPEILMTLGVLGVVTSAVLACKATLKAKDILEQTKEDLAEVEKCVNNENLVDVYSEDDAKKDTAIIYVQTGVKLAKAYAPAVILGTLSIFGLVASHKILQKRNVALVAAYTAVDKSFKEYRNRVIEKFGKETDNQLRYNVQTKTFEEVSVDENGNEVIINKEVQVSDLSKFSDYARYFDNSCTGWERDYLYNLMFLKAQQKYANDLLIAKKRVFLNDIYDLLGIERSKAGQIVGWVYNPDNPSGDNYIDFGIFESNIMTDNGRYDNVIILDFNVDGNVWEGMK